MVFDTIKKQFVWLINELGCCETFSDKYPSFGCLCGLLNLLGRELQSYISAIRTSTI